MTAAGAASIRTGSVRENMEMCLKGVPTRSLAQIYVFIYVFKFRRDSGNRHANIGEIIFPSVYRLN